jgi:hypothetical protein
MLQQCIEIGLLEISREAAKEGLLTGRWIWKITSPVHHVSLCFCLMADGVHT